MTKRSLGSLKDVPAPTSRNTPAVEVWKTIGTCVRITHTVDGASLRSSNHPSIHRSPLEPGMRPTDLIAE